MIPIVCYAGVNMIESLLKIKLNAENKLEGSIITQTVKKRL
jgi:hypothetical protein